MTLPGQYACNKREVYRDSSLHLSVLVVVCYEPHQEKSISLEFLGGFARISFPSEFFVLFLFIFVSHLFQRNYDN